MGNTKKILAEFEDPCAEKLIFSDKTSLCTIDCALKHISLFAERKIVQVEREDKMSYTTIIIYLYIYASILDIFSALLLISMLFLS